MPPICVLNIGGLDPSSGAGITADVKTCELMGVYGLSCATAITSQNHESFRSVQWVSKEEIIEQLESLVRAYNIKAIKIGLIQNLSTLSELLDYLTEHLPEAPLIWDPILSASAGFDFHTNIDAVLLKSLLSRLNLITPNKTEATLLFPQLQKDSLERLSLHSCSLFIKSWIQEEDVIKDVLVNSVGLTYLPHDRFEHSETHGSGCFLSTAIACEIAEGKEMLPSLKLAQQLTAQYLATSKGKMGFHSLVSPLALEAHT